MQAVAPAASRHQPPGELVDNDDAAVLDHVVDVEAEQRVCAQPLVHVVEQRHVRRIVETVRTGHEAMREHLLGLRHAGFRQRDRLVLFVDDVVAGLFELLALFLFDLPLRDGALLQPRNDAIDFVIQVGRFLGWA